MSWDLSAFGCFWSAECRSDDPGLLLDLSFNCLDSFEFDRSLFGFKKGVDPAGANLLLPRLVSSRGGSGGPGGFGALLGRLGRGRFCIFSGVGGVTLSFGQAGSTNAYSFLQEIVSLSLSLSAD